MLILQQAISISQLKELAQINIRSWQGNPSRDVEDPEVREAIKSIVDKFITA